MAGFFILCISKYYLNRRLNSSQENFPLSFIKRIYKVNECLELLKILTIKNQLNLKD